MQTLRWILKDKYNWDEKRIVEAVVGSEKNLPPEVIRDLTRIAAGEPLQYVIGWVNFLGCRIDLSYRPLIPRPETEFWTEKFLERVKKQQGRGELKILDLCCGSGCIGIAVLKSLPQAHVDFADISEAALKQTARNLEINGGEAVRFQLVHSDLFSAISGEYDYILCNPPYVDRAGKTSVVLAYEPEQSLFAQNHGLDLIQKIISTFEKHVKKGGELWMEFGQGQEKSVQQFCQSLGQTVRVEMGQDQYGVVRYVVVTKV